MTTTLQASKEQMIELLMALVGRCQPNPPSYRQHLNALDYQELQELYRDAMEKTLEDGR